MAWSERHRNRALNPAIPWGNIDPLVDAVRATDRELSEIHAAHMKALDDVIAVFDNLGSVGGRDV